MAEIGSANSPVRQTQGKPSMKLIANPFIGATVGYQNSKRYAFQRGTELQFAADQKAHQDKLNEIADWLADLIGTKREEWYELVDAKIASLRGEVK